MFFLSRINLATFFGFPFIPSCFYTGYCFLKGVNRFTRSLKLFRISRLFHYLVIKVPLPVFPRGFLLSCEAAFIYYHTVFALSTTFLKIFFSKLVCLSRLLACASCLFLTALTVYHAFYILSRTFFKFFRFFSSAVNPEKRTEKEGFEPSRRY